MQRVSCSGDAFLEQTDAGLELARLLAEVALVGLGGSGFEGLESLGGPAGGVVVIGDLSANEDHLLGRFGAIECGAGSSLEGGVVAGVGGEAHLLSFEFEDVDGLASLFQDKPVRHDVAMTGEITLRGLVLPIGGVKEKVLAAKRAGIRTVILPERNRKDLTEVPKGSTEGITFAFARTVDDVLKTALDGNRIKSRKTRGR